MARFTFRLPDIGEGIAEAEIVAWHKQPGDRIAENEALADMMTDKPRSSWNRRSPAPSSNWRVKPARALPSVRPRRFDRVHLGIATQTDAGLMLPVLRDAQACNLWQIAGETVRLAQAARTGQASRRLIEAPGLLFAD